MLAGASSIAACSLTTIPDLTSGLGPAADGGLPADGSAGGLGDADVRFCATLGRVSTLCDDFDGDPELANRWSRVHRFDGLAGVAIDSALSRSQPSSLVSRVEPGAEECAYATVEKDVDGAFTSAHLDYWVFRERAPTSGSIISVQSFGAGSALCQAFVAAGPGTLSLSEQIIHADGGREEADHDTAVRLAVGGWSHVVVDYDVAATRLVLTVDGRTALDAPTALACPYAPGPVSVHVGLFCEPVRAESRTIHFDDLVFDTR